jgi:hypothetical protein
MASRPHAATALPVRQAAEKPGKVDFSNLWPGRRCKWGRKCRPPSCRALAASALACMSRYARVKSRQLLRLRRKSGLCYTAG